MLQKRRVHGAPALPRLNGNLTPDLSLLEETVAYIREMCDIVVEISTGGVSNLTIEERVQPCYPSWVEANSLNVAR